MPAGTPNDDSDGDPSPKISLGQRFLLAMPHLGRHEEKTPLGERVRGAVLKPAEPGETSRKSTPDKPESIEELEDAVRWADDKERLIGLIGAPLGALIGLLIITALVNHDPAARFKNGQLNSHHVNVSIYHELLIVLLVLSVLMLAFAWFRKRLFLGMVIALYGLAVFNLHYWGFGIPFVMAGAWLLVRAYRLQRDLRVATGDLAPRPDRGVKGRGSAGASVLKRRSNPLYSPKPAPEDPGKTKPEKRKKAG